VREGGREGERGELAESRRRYPPLRWHGGHREKGRKEGRSGSPEATTIALLSRSRREGRAAVARE